MYRFIQSQAALYAVEAMCRVLQVSRSAYYDYLQTTSKRGADEKKKEVEERIVSIFEEHCRRYGVRRIGAELQARGMQVGAIRCVE